MADTEKCDCCRGIRNPSAAYPWSEMLHCRTLIHICNMMDVDIKETKNWLKTYNAKIKIAA